jgi:hypothetical protein
MRAAIVFALFALAVPPLAQETKPATPPATPQVPARKPTDPKPYKEVITAEAKTQTGLFKVHRIDDKLFWEIPAGAFGREMLWQTEIAQLPQGAGYPGTSAGTQVVRLERRNNKVFMRMVGHGLRTSDHGGGLAKGIAMNSVEPIVQAWDIQALGEGDAPVIEVTQLFMTDPTDFQVKPLIGGAGVDPGKSYLDSVKVFPINIETRSMLTFMRGPRGFSFFGGNDGPSVNASTVTALVHYSLVLLPEKPMMGRLKDSRIGYFTVGFDQIDPTNRVKPTEYITRFRLEKKNPSQAVSEVKQPIVFYLAREVPEYFRPYIKKGIEQWQTAYEKAGFKNAIIAKDAPSEKEDPNWDAEDARYSVIRWAPSRIANAMGPSIQDPRSGETISAHIIFWHNIIDILESWYFCQCGAIDPRANKLPLPDALKGELVQYVTAHEVGHTLGLEHNFRSSVARSIQQLRDPEFMKTHAVSSSIMSYSRNNYVAQPGDGITSSTNGIIGEYDDFAIDYGYRVIPGATTPQEEVPNLDRLLSRQITDRTVRFGNYKYYGLDPTTQSENIGDDAVTATRLGLKNLDRTAANLVKATARFGEDYSYTQNIFSEMVFHRMIWLDHVMSQVGGVVENDVHAGRGGAVFAPVPAATQRNAVVLLVNEGLNPQAGLMQPSIINRLSFQGVYAPFLGTANMILNGLYDDGIANRLGEQKVRGVAVPYALEELVATVQAGVWRELAANTPKTDTYRRSLQRNYLDLVDRKLIGASRSRSDLGPVLKENLRAMRPALKLAIARASDGATRRHLTECQAEIKRILAGRPRQGGGGGSMFEFSMFGLKPNPNARGCFDMLAGLRQKLGN